MLKAYSVPANQLFFPQKLSASFLIVDGAINQVPKFPLYVPKASLVSKDK